LGGYSLFSGPQTPGPLKSGPVRNSVEFAAGAAQNCQTRGPAIARAYLKKHPVPKYAFGHETDRQ